MGWWGITGWNFDWWGRKANRAAIGARVTVRTGKLVQFDEVRGGASYLSQNDLRVHFGLGKAVGLDSVEVLWPGGAVEKFSGVAADKIYTLIEGQGIRGAAATVLTGDGKSKAPQMNADEH